MATKKANKTKSRIQAIVKKIGMVDWKPSKHEGVRYYEHPTRKHKGKPDRNHFIRYTSHGVRKSEPVGWSSGGVTEQFCNQERSEILKNIHLGEGHFSLREKRESKNNGGDNTLEKMYEQYKAEKGLTDRTIRDYDRAMKIAFPDWRKKKVSEIDRAMVLNRWNKLKREVEAREQARRKAKDLKFTKVDREKVGETQIKIYFRFLSAVINFAIILSKNKNGVASITHNPVSIIKETQKWPKSQRKRTIIIDEDLPRWFQAVLDLKNETIRDFIIFAFLTGCRKTEGLSLEIENVDLENKTFTFPEPKNGIQLTLPMGNYLFDVLNRRIKILKEKHHPLTPMKYVFPGERGGDKGYLVEPKKGLAKVVEQSRVKFTLHDLRRVFITCSNNIKNITRFDAKCLVNHKIPESDITDGYTIPRVADLREPMQRMEDRLLMMCEVNEPGQIIQLNRGTSK
jgi:integrase